MALFTVVLLLLVNLAWWLFYERTEALLAQQLSRRLAAVVKITSIGLAPEVVQSLAAGDMGRYVETLEILMRAREADSLADIFILDDNYRYLASSSLEVDSVYFLAGLNGPYIDSLFFGLADEAVVTPSYRTGQVYLKSAFAPLYDSLGSVAAVLGAEASADYFDALADLKHNLYYSSGLSLAGGILFAALFLLVQRRLNRAEQRLFLSETHAYLGRMVAVVAHEVRNPLMIVRASAERMAKKHETPECEFIVEEVDRLNQIVSGYLDFAGGSRGTFLRSEKADSIVLRDLYLGIRKHLQDKYPDQHVEWLSGKLEDDLSFHGYRRSLRQVLLNLLINSADACLAASKPIVVGLFAKNRGDNITLTVADHGPGMNRKDIKRAFDPFYTTRQSGSGLGLYLSRKLVEEMGGAMDIGSRVGGGTEVVIVLPRMPRK